MATRSTSSKTAKDKKPASGRATRGRETAAKGTKPQARATTRPTPRAVAKSAPKPQAKRAAAPAAKPVAKRTQKAQAPKPAAKPAKAAVPRSRVARSKRAAPRPAQAKPPAPADLATARVPAEQKASAPLAAAEAPAKPGGTDAAPRERVVPTAVAPPPLQASTAPEPPARPTKAEAAVAAGGTIEFAVGDHVVYPTHGVGRVTGIVTEEIAGHRLTLIVVEFEDNRMVLRVPVAKAKSAGLRKLSSRKAIEEALATLKGRARIKRTMWSRRAQEYEAKINSGDPVAIAEVVRDLHRNAGQPDQSFSERQIYEQALDRLAAELAAIEQVDKATAAAKLASYLKAA